MPKLKFLNTREIKKLKQVLEKQFSHSLQEDYAYVINEKQRLFVVNKDIVKIELKNLRIDKMGLYLGEYKQDFIRLSKEGAQLLVEDAEKFKGKINNLVEINKEQVEKYFKGDDLAVDLGENNRLIILKYNQHILGCASYKNSKILNFLPKIHRGTVIL